MRDMRNNQLEVQLPDYFVCPFDSETQLYFHRDTYRLSFIVTSRISFLSESATPSYSITRRG